jgi:chromosome segregation ATPase
MADIDDQIIEHLLCIRRALDALREDVRELKQPVGALEGRSQEISRQLERINSRIARIEQRLNLVDA